MVSVLRFTCKLKSHCVSRSRVKFTLHALNIDVNPFAHLDKKSGKRFPACFTRPKDALKKFSDSSQERPRRHRGLPKQREATADTQREATEAKVTRAGGRLTNSKHEVITIYSAEAPCLGNNTVHVNTNL